MPSTDIVRADPDLWSVDLSAFQDSIRRIARSRANAIQDKRRTHKRAFKGHGDYNLSAGHLYGACGEAAYAMYHGIPLSALHGSLPQGDGGIDFYHPFIKSPRMVTVDVKHTSQKDATSMYIPIFGDEADLRASVYVLARRGEKYVFEGTKSFYKPDAFAVILQGWIARPEIKEVGKEISHPNDGQRCLEVPFRYLRPIQTLSQWMKHDRSLPAPFDTMEAYPPTPGDLSDYRNLTEEHLTEDARRLPFTRKDRL